MTQVLGFYQGLAARMNNQNPNYAFDDIAGMLGPEDQLVKVQGADDLTGVTMQGAELLELSRFWQNEAIICFPQRDFQNLLSYRFAALVMAAYSAKRELGGATLALGKQGGMLPQLLRPATVLSTSSTVIETWVPTSNPTAGWNVSYFNINLNTSSSGGNAGKLQNLVTSVIFGLADFATAPNIQEIQVLDASGSKYGVYSFPFTKVYDGTSLYLLPEAYIQKLNENWTIDVNFIAAAATVPVLIGAQFAKNQLATAE